jgi:hypothetical protein
MKEPNQIGSLATVMHAAFRNNALLGGAALAATLALAVGERANAQSTQFVDFGTSFQVSDTNAPDTFSGSYTLNDGNTSLDGGALVMNTSTYAASGGGEWVIFTFTTPSGSLSNDPSSPFELSFTNVMLTPAGQAATPSEFYFGFGNNGTLESATNNYPGYAPQLETNPFTGSGNVFGLPATRQSYISDGINLGAINQLSLLGYTNTSNLNTYQAGFLLEPVPEPSTLWLLLGGLSLLGLTRSRRLLSSLPRLSAT